MTKTKPRSAALPAATALFVGSIGTVGVREGDTVTPTATHGLSLQRTAFGWGLRDACGEAVFTAEGRDARRRCLARAAELGILHLRFDEQPRAIALAAGASTVASP